MPCLLIGTCSHGYADNSELNLLILQMSEHSFHQNAALSLSSSLSARALVPCSRLQSTGWRAEPDRRYVNVLTWWNCSFIHWV